MEENKKAQKRLSLITDIIIFLGIVFVTVQLFTLLDFNGYNEDEVYSLASSTNNTNIQSENDNYISKIKEEYGIIVMYGSKILDYANKVEAVPQYNEYIINNNLKIIYNALGKYPNDIFFKMKTKQNPMYIMLVDKFENNNIALASKTSLNVYRLYISNNEKFERSFHHEMYHIIEYLMEEKNKYIYSSWYRLNPLDFKYSEDITKLDYTYVYNQDTYLKDSADIYFTSKYSKASAKEDRAEIFSELMILKEKNNFIFYNKNILNKIDMMEDTIGNYLTKSSFYFEYYK